MQILGTGICMPAGKVPKALVKKTIRVMRMTTLILLVACMQVSAQSAAQITLHVKKGRLQEVLESIRRQSGYDLVYDVAMVKQKATPVSMHVTNVSVDEALRTLLTNQPLSYEITGNHIIYIKEKTVYVSLSAPPTHTVTGRVVNEKGEPLAGAIVAIKNTGRATVTDEKGGFGLANVNEDETLVFSFVNMQTMELPLQGKAYIAVTMKSFVNELGEIAVQVNNGYQTLSRQRASGAFAKPDMEVFKARTGTINIQTRLEGLIPGLTIIPGPRVITSNRDGANSDNQALIRGSSSIQLNNDPLYVVNGIQVKDLNNINPDDVADITVLKDAAAAAIWGARAANGVIVITTRNGNRNEKMNISYSGFVNFQGRPDFDYVPMLTSKQYIQAARETFNAANYPWENLSYPTSFVAPHDLILYNQSRGLITKQQADAQLDSLAGIDNRQQVKDLLYRNALLTNHTLALSGGSNTYDYYASLAYSNTLSNRPGDKNQVYRLTLNQNFQPVRGVKVGLNAMLANTRTETPRNIAIQNNFLPYQLFRDAAGHTISMAYVQGMNDSLRASYQARSRINLDYNPLDERGYGYTKSNAMAVNLSSNIEVKLYKGLSFRGTYGIVTDQDRATSYDDGRSYTVRKELLTMTVAPSADVPPVYYLPNTGGKYSVTHLLQRNWTVRNQLVYQFSGRNGRDMMSVQAGQEAQEQMSILENSTVRGYNEAMQSFVSLDYNLLGRGISNTVWPYGGRFNEQPYIQEERRQRFASYFAMLNYLLDRKYSIDLSWRVDKSSLFGKDISVQNKPVWSVGGKWQIGRERFMEKVHGVNDLALRVTYGLTGNSPFAGAAALYDILTPDFIPNIAGAALNITELANRKVTWERTATRNIGVDIAVLDRRLKMSVDYYYKNTTNLLGTVNVNPLTGINSAVGNLGRLVNKGVEVAITAVPVEKKDFRWQTALNLSYNTNRLKDYIPLSAYTNTAGSKVYTSSYWLGYPMQPVFAYHYAGLDNMGDPQIKQNDGTITKTPYAARPEDVYYMGTLVPKVTGGFTNSLQYKAFTLTANIIFNLGHVMRKDVNAFYSDRLTGITGQFAGNISPLFLNRWKKPGDEAFTDVPSYVSDMNDHYNRRDINYYTYSDVNVVSASYIKLRDITLSYKLPATALQLLHMTGMTVYMQSGNFMLWKANKNGIDPEYHTLANGVRRMPAFRHSWSLGANINF